jgi:hypothetical protein
MVRCIDQYPLPTDETVARDEHVAAFSDFEVIPVDDSFADSSVHESTSVDQATGMVAVQLDDSIAAALSALIAHATNEDRSLQSVAADVVDRRLVFPLSHVQGEQTSGVEDWYAENSRRAEASFAGEPVDADRWLYVHRSEVVGASSAAAAALVRDAGMVAHVDRHRRTAPSSRPWDSTRISLFIGADDTVTSADWG